MAKKLSKSIGKYAELTSKNRAVVPLTRRNETSLSVTFRDRLEKGYTFDLLEKHHLKDLQKFLDISSQLTADELFKKYERKPDKNDEYKGGQVIHLGIGETFRIHGVIEDCTFMVIRLDPNHKYHK